MEFYALQMKDNSQPRPLLIYIYMTIHPPPSLQESAEVIRDSKASLILHNCLAIFFQRDEVVPVNGSGGRTNDYSTVIGGKDGVMRYTQTVHSVWFLFRQLHLNIHSRGKKLSGR